MKIFFAALIAALAFLLSGCASSVTCGSQSYINGDWTVDSPENHGADPKLINDFIKSASNDAAFCAVIVKDGVIIAEYYDKEHDESSKFHLFSCTKSVMSAVYGIALDKKEIKGTDTPISEFFPKIAGEKYKKDIKIENLLNLTTGIDWPEITEGGAAYGYDKWLFSENWVDFVLDRKMNAAPGISFNYDSGSVHLLSAIMQKSLKNVPVSEYAKKNLFDKIGVKNVEWLSDPQKITTGGFGIFLTARDSARFGQLYVNNGKWGKEQVISENWIKTSTQKQSDGLKNYYSYGYLWWVGGCAQNLKYDMYFAQGYGGQYIIIVPELKLVTVVTAENTSNNYMGYFLDYVIKAFE